MNITPDQARELLDGATPGPWTMHRYIPEDFIRVTGEDLKDIADNGIVEDGDAHLIAAAPDLAQAIAGMEWQTGVITGGETLWAENAAEEVMARGASKLPASRLVRRLVGPVEVIDGE